MVLDGSTGEDSYACFGSTDSRHCKFPCGTSRYGIVHLSDGRLLMKSGYLIPSQTDKFSDKATQLPPILHFTAREPYTKYEICLVLAAHSNPPLPHGHIVPDDKEPVITAGGVGRPRDCQLDVRIIEDPVEKGGLGMNVETQGFKEWWVVELSGGGASCM